MLDSDPAATFDSVAEALNACGLAYLHIVEPRIRGNDTVNANAAPVATRALRRIFKGPIIAAGGFDRVSANRVVAAGDADLVAFGRNFIANPDLVGRLRQHLPLNTYNRSTFYGGDWRGYTDDPRAMYELVAGAELQACK